MHDNYKEKAFESAIEDYLLTKAGYIKADAKAFDTERGLDPSAVLSFIQSTQPREWSYLVGLQKDRAEQILLDDLCRALNSEHEGCLHVLRHGFKCFGKLFHMAYFAPASGLNPETQKLYAANRLSITRQLKYSSKHSGIIDLVISLNGLPVATAELKNPLTGQNWRNAVNQYRDDRDPISDIPVQKTHAGLFRRRSGRSLHDHPAYLARVHSFSPF